MASRQTRPAALAREVYEGSSKSKGPSPKISEVIQIEASDKPHVSGFISRLSQGVPRKTRARYSEPRFWPVQKKIRREGKIFIRNSSGEKRPERGEDIGIHPRV
ncbi:hypothetical protein KM043_015297 [Ampulex compressa]|nr:hypothetical protein KM043_015297 [Ampulex compressa]